MFLSKLYHKADKSLAMSAPLERTLHGVRIRKLPVGKYIQVMRALEDAPQILLGELFPNGITIDQLLSLSDKDKLSELAFQLLTVAPEQVCRIIGGFLGIPAEKLLDPERGLSLAELAEVIEAFWRVNDLSGFFGTVRRLTGQADTPNTGSSAGLPSHRM